MPCYAINPVLLYTSDCHRTVCIHCRTDFRLLALIEGDSATYGEILRNAPSAAVPAPLAGRWPASDKNPGGG